MIVKMLGSKITKGAKVIDYCLNPKRIADGTARVIKGDELTTRSLIEISPYSQKATFGVLSFAEVGKSFPEEIKLNIIKNFERAFFGDFMKERANVLWVEHTDKNGRLELNFIVNNLDLKSGKSYNPYQFKRDVKRLSAFAEFINNAYNLLSPKNPSSKATHNVNTKSKGLKKKAEKADELDQQILEQITLENITNREQVIEFIKAQGHEVTRVANSTTKNGASISVKLAGTKKAFKLKGYYCNENFTTTRALRQVLREHRAEQEQYSKRDRRSICRSYEKFIEQGIEYLDRELKAKYSKYPTISEINTRNGKELEKDREQDEQLRRNTKSAQFHSRYSEPSTSNEHFNSNCASNSIDNTLMVKDKNDDTERERIASAIEESNDIISRAREYNTKAEDANTRARDTNSTANTEIERAKRRKLNQEQELQKRKLREQEMRELRETEKELRRINEQQSSRIELFKKVFSRLKDRIQDLKHGVKEFADGIKEFAGRVKSFKTEILNKQQNEQNLETEQEPVSRLRL